MSGNLLQVLGVSPILGAGFPAEQFYSRDRMVLISERLWRARFGGAADGSGETSA